MLCSPRSFAKITTQIAAHCTSRCNNVCNTLQLSKSFCMLDSICVFHLDHSSTAFDEWRCDANQVGCNTPHHTLQHTTTHYNTLQHTAAHCNTLQHTAGTVSDVRHCGNVATVRLDFAPLFQGGFSLLLFFIVLEFCLCVGGAFDGAALRKFCDDMAGFDIESLKPVVEGGFLKGLARADLEVSNRQSCYVIHMS